MNKCSTELQSGWDWKAPLEVIWFQHLTQAGPLEPAAKDDDQIVFEYLSPMKETPQPLYATLCHWSVTLTIREHVLMSRHSHLQSFLYPEPQTLLEQLNLGEGASHLFISKLLRKIKCFLKLYFLKFYAV